MATSTSPNPATFWLDTDGAALRRADDRSRQLIHDRLAEDARRPRVRTGAYVSRGDNAAVNASALRQIARGADDLMFRLYRQPTVDDLEVMLRDIPLDELSLHCSLRYPGQDPAELFRDLVRYLRRHDYSPGDVSGSVDFDPLLDWSEPPYPPLIRLLYFVNRWMPHFRVLQVNAAGFNNGPELADTELALAVAKGVAYLREIDARGYPAALAARHLQFALSLGTSPTVDAAKLRALPWLWVDALAEAGYDAPARTHVVAHSDVASLSYDVAENPPRLAAHAVAAQAGGVDTLFLAPASGIGAPATQAGRRTTYTIQERLRSGAFMDVVDEEVVRATAGRLRAAAAGRYRIIEQQGGFAAAADL